MKQRPPRLRKVSRRCRPRVPQHTKQEAPVRVLHGLDRAIEGPSSGCQAAGRAHPLVVVRGDGGLAAEDAGQPASRVHRHVMPGVLTGYGAVLVVADDVGQVLEQRAAVRDTEQLHAATDPEDGRRARRRRRALRTRHRRGSVAALRAQARLLPVPRRVDVRAAGENECVETGDDVQAGSGGNRTGCRPPLMWAT